MSNLEEKKKIFAQHVRKLQTEIIKNLEKLDSKLQVTLDSWKRQDHSGQEGGGGITGALSGDLIENAGVNTSEIYGQLDPQFASKLGSSSTELWASGISLIIHPRNPKVPTVHANFRMIHTGDKFWFGGGADLTPYYPYVEDFQYFHRVWERACQPYGTYDDMKKQCDEYFCNHHRNREMRGIGGIFFDHFNTGDIEKDMEMTFHLSNHFLTSYIPIVEKRLSESWSPDDEDFQLHRRGRYVEFNLLHDRGTKFGLKSNGRTDSILISLPARCRYTYCYKPKPSSPHEEMMTYYYPKSWVTDS